MLRSLLRASAAVAFASLLAPAAPGAAAAPGLAYDEIVRVVVNATPPPPGNFAADLAALGTAQAVAASPTPAPKKHGLGLGSLTSIAGGLAGGLSGGNVAGGVMNSVANQVVSTAMSSVLSNAIQRSVGSQFSGLAAAAQSFLQPHLTHYAYLNGWVREDDVAAQTATIRKCDAGQVIRLDLAHKTYTIYDPASEPTDAPAPAPPHSRRGPPPAEAPQQPGTAVVSLTSTTKALGPLQIQDQATTGFDSATTFAMSQSTGSCHDSNATFEETQYVAAVNRPVVNGCPIRRRPIPQSAEEMVTAPRPASVGCRPASFTARRAGPTPPSNRLALYSLMRFSAAASASPPAGSPASGPIGFLTERGNLKTLGPADAGLFAIPEGFTKSP